MDVHFLLDTDSTDVAVGAVLSQIPHDVERHNLILTMLDLGRVPQLVAKSFAHDDTLVYPKLDVSCILNTDASDVVIGAVLSQVTNGTERPIAVFPPCRVRVVFLNWFPQSLFVTTLSFMPTLTFLVSSIQTAQRSRLGKCLAR